nr:hypothetical protein [Tanacetum cinerariifolium]
DGVDGVFLVVIIVGDLMKLSSVNPITKMLIFPNLTKFKPHSHSDEIADLEPEATTDTELSGAEDIHPLAVQEQPQDSDICQLINECCEEVPEQQNMEKTMLDLVKICKTVSLYSR